MRWSAHNSYVHAYTELGLVGGTFFLGAFYLAFEQLRRLRRAAATIADPEMRRLGPYLASVVVRYAAGLMSLSRLDVVPTYLVLALPTAYATAADPDGSKASLPLDGRLVHPGAAARLPALGSPSSFIPLLAP